MYRALIEESSARASLLAQQIIEEGGTPASVLNRLLVRLFEFAEDDQDYRAVAALSLHKSDSSPELAAIGEEFLESRRVLGRFFTKLIKEGIKAGEFHPEVSPEDVALALVGYINGMGLIWIQDPALFSIRERAESLVDIFLAGIVGA